MTTTAANSVFVDTNLLIYTRLATSAFHAAAVATLDTMAQSGFEFWFSHQIIREYLASMTRPGVVTPAPTISSLVADVTGFLARLRVVEDGPQATTQLLSLLGTVPCAGKQVHDANIVATMIAHGIPSLLTNNPSDYNRFSRFTTIVPLVTPAPVTPAHPPSPPTPGAP